MSVLYYVLTAWVIALAGTVRSTTTGDGQTKGVARPLSSGSPRINKTPFVSLRLGKPYDYAATQTHHEGMKTEERMYPWSNTLEKIGGLGDSMQDVSVKTKEAIKNINDRIKTKQLVEMVKIGDQEMSVPLLHDGLQTQNRRRDYADSLSAIKDSTLKWIKSTYRNVMYTRTDELIESVHERMAAEKLVEEGRIVDQEMFVQLLRDEFGTQELGWIYHDVVRSLTMRKRIFDPWFRRVQPKDLAKAFHSLRGYPGMKAHADLMQRDLAYTFPNVPEGAMFPLWLESTLTPEEVFHILPSGYSEEFPGLRDAYGWDYAVDEYSRMVLPILKYVGVYRQQYGYSEEAFKELMKGYAKIGENLGLQIVW